LSRQKLAVAKSLVAFDWSSVGPGPGPDEFELSFFGPGFGECVVVHVGDGRWAIVDSCVDTKDTQDRRPVAEKYLRAIGVPLNPCVELIVASHWHSDHVRGLGRLVEQCGNAKFACAQAMVNEEFQVFAEQMATAAAATDGAKLADFREAIRHIKARNGVVRFATGNKLMGAWPSSRLPGTNRCSISALSPSDSEFTLFLAEIAAARPQPTGPKRAAVPSSPNLVSVVLHVQFAGVSVLLGADMEAHHDPSRGWTAAVAEGRMAGLAKADVLKVPHHGSQTGHHDEVWRDLLISLPLGVVTPFNRLPDDKKLPTTDDVLRLQSLTSRLFQTAPALRSNTRGREAAVERGLVESNIVIRDSAVAVGLVRMRWNDATGWTTALFPPAAELVAP
jgi:beta-lactamase superfamily II metal-dependent hydrolase